MSNIINKTDHGINFGYDALDGLSIPTKLITVNNSDYKLINSKDIDWNNSFLSYIPQIQNISDYIKQQYVNDDVKDDKKPYWKNKGQVNSSQELLDIINYLISRVIYADQKIQEFIDKENLTKITLIFEGDDVEVDNNQNPKPFEFYLVPNKYDSRTKNFDVKTHPKIDASVTLNLRVSISTPNDGSIIPSQIFTAQSFKVLSGSEGEEISSYFDVTLDAYGFNRNCNEVELIIQFTTMVTEKFDAIEPISTFIKIHKDDNPIEYLVINDEVYKVYKPEKFANLFGEKSTIYGAILEKELEILKKDNYGEYIFEENIKPFTSPTEHSLAWFIMEGKFHFFDSRSIIDGKINDKDSINISNIKINIPRQRDTKIEIYTKYDKTNCLDLQDTDDNKPIDCYFILSGLNESSSKTTHIKNPQGTDIFNDYLECNRTIVCTRSINGKERKGFSITLNADYDENSSASFNMNLYLSGTKYIKHYAEICLPFAITQATYLELFENKNNVDGWNTMNNPKNINDDKLITSLEGDINTGYVFNVGIPLFTHKSFTESQLTDAEFTNGIKMSIPIFKQLNNIKEYGLFDVKIHESGKNITDLVEIDYESTWLKVSQVCPDMCKYVNISNSNMTNYDKGKALLDNFIKFNVNTEAPGFSKYKEMSLSLLRATTYKHQTNYRVFSRENDDTAVALPIICKIPGHISGMGELYDELKFTLNLTIYRGSSDLIALDYATDDKGNKRSVYAELLKPIKFSNLYKSHNKEFGGFEYVSTIPENYHYITSRSETFLIFNVDDYKLMNNKWFGISDSIDASVNAKDSINTSQITFIRNNWALDKKTKNFEYTEYIVGDINGDGNVDFKDSESLNEKINSGNFTHKESIICDLNGDGVVNELDSQELDIIIRGGYNDERRIYTNDYDITHSLPVEDAKYSNSETGLSGVNKFELLANDQYYGARVANNKNIEFNLSFDIKKINDDYNTLSDKVFGKNISGIGTNVSNLGYNASCILDSKQYNFYTVDNEEFCEISISNLFSTQTSTYPIKDKISIESKNFELFGKIILTNEDYRTYVSEYPTDLTLWSQNMKDDRIIFDYVNDKIKIKTTDLWQTWRNNVPDENYKNNVVVKLAGWKYQNEIYNGKVFHMTIILKPA